MRIAALYDIHGNLPALQAALADVAAADVDQIVVGGDVLPGPLPSECLELLASLEVPVHYIRGNGEREVLATLAGKPSEVLPPPVQDAIRWTGEQLSAEQVAHVATWPLTKQLDVKGIGRVLFFHATPTDDNQIFTKRTPVAALEPIFGAVEAPVVVCGHTHMQFDRRIGPTRVVNAGSVGMPFGASGAYWLLVGPDVELQRTPVNVEFVADRLGGSSYPGVAQFLESSIRQPPSEETMLDLFAQSELR